MKKIICSFILLSLMLTIVGCKENTGEQNLLIDAQNEMEYFEASVRGVKREVTDLSIDVNQVAENSYEVTLFEETKQNDFFEFTSYSDAGITGACKLDADAMSCAKQVLRNVIKYINDSDVLKNKQEIIKKIKSVKIKFADISVSGIYENNVIYINKSLNKNDYIYVMTHQYVHALHEITNGCEKNIIYNHSVFNETLTDAISKQICPDSYNLNYSDYYHYILVYIGCFEKQALEAYFYGYEDIWEQTEKDDFDFFVQIFANVTTDEYASDCFTALIYKWQGLD